ncbi:SOS response-associated peptidase [Paenibacillus sp. GCM10027626]|uniref:SOS response-associated peptidase n=1 Tax=Paenibacillus sp. GCM10027626 TaxID=3273411 RepID=UPI003641EC28
MCGRYTLTVTLEELMLRYMIGETAIPFHKPQYNIAPRQMIAAVVHDGANNRLGQLQWGLVPSWSDSPQQGHKMINARSESVFDKPAFKSLIRRRRCIIPADGFYEWKLAAGGKQPMRIVMRDRSLFSLAGLYDIWQSPDGSRLSTCTILTTEPNELMAPIHNRMPVILQPEDEQLWLDRKLHSSKPIEPLLRPFPAELLEAYPVTAAVGNVKFDTAVCIEPALIMDELFSDG